MKKLLSIMGFILMVTGCVTAPQVIAPFDTSATSEASFDETWTKLVRFMTTNQIGIATIEKDSGLIVMDNDNLQTDLTLKYCDAPSAVGWPYSLIGGQVSGNVNVVSDAGFTTVSVNTTFRAVSEYCGNNGCQTRVRVCNSNGNFEGEVLDAVK